MGEGGTCGFVWALSSVMFKTPRREGRQPSVTRLEVLPGGRHHGGIGCWLVGMASVQEQCIGDRWGIWERIPGLKVSLFFKEITDSLSLPRASQVSRW